MKNQIDLAPAQKTGYPLALTKRMTIRANPNFATSTNQLHIQKAYSRLNWLTVLRTARVAGMNA
jgi:hypothetical protein